MIFAEISKDLRKSKNLSQLELAAAMKVSRSCISMIEVGKNEPTANTLIRYADYFQCSTDYLLGREDDFGNINIYSEPLSVDEQKLLEAYRALSKENKLRLTAYADIRREEQKK